MIRLSVNVNKVATLRNSRGGNLPNVVDAVKVCLAAGARGITVHPRADERHIRRDDVREVAELLRDARAEGVEFNIEGDPRPDWLELVHEVRPDQATLVPVRAGETTSEAGWGEDADAVEMQRVIGELRGAGVRVSLFVNADSASIAWAHRMGGDRVELYTGPFAQAFAADRDQGLHVFAAHANAAGQAHALGLGINAGHDLDLDNLVLYRTLPNLAEVSIGHALIAHALYVGLDRAVRDYAAAVSG